MTDEVKPASASNLDRQRETLEEKQRFVKAEFVEVELDLAVTFCQIALSTGNLEKLERNEGHAEQAYQSALHFLNTVEAPEALKKRIQDKLARLQTMLEEVHRKL